MKTTKHKNGHTVTTSRYDSGTHLGFTVDFVEEGSYCQESLDMLLTKEEINSLEMIIAATVKGFLEARKQ